MRLSERLRAYLRRSRIGHLYQEVDVPPYWIVDPEHKAVESWTPEAQFPSVEWKRVEWKPPGAADAFALELEELFRPI